MQSNLTSCMLNPEKSQKCHLRSNRIVTNKLPPLCAVEREKWTAYGGRVVNLNKVANLEALRRLRKKEKEDPDLGQAAVITDIPYQLKRSVLRNGMFLIDKPVDWTAFEVVKALKWSLKMGRQAKVGHVGAMDAMASGLLIVCTCSATRYTNAFHDLEKEYVGTIRLGLSTDTFDANGKGVSSMPWRHITDDQLQSAAAIFRGEVLLVPPMLSALKVAGKPMYKFLEQGVKLEREPRPVYIPHFSVSRVEPGSRDVSFRLVTARGGFVRAIANDFGSTLGTVSHLAELRRVRVGSYKVEDAWPLDVVLPLIRKFAPGYRA